MIAAGAACFVAWALAPHVGYLVAGIGFLVVAPVWFEAPPRFSARLGEARRKLSKASVVLAFIGYPLICAGIVLRLVV
jgi:hypothetical protein